MSNVAPLRKTSPASEPQSVSVTTGALENWFGVRGSRRRGRANVPFVDPQSTTVAVPPAEHLMTACRRDTDAYGSSRRFGSGPSSESGSSGIMRAIYTQQDWLAACEGGQRSKRTIDVEPLWRGSIMEEGLEDAQGLGGGGRGRGQCELLM